ncbi:MAG: murein L,D-transpeptidase catalytic domain family protein [Flavobacteriaceae bacterium]|nr:murein L,D-transpeptidase catalytic domain family protein [Flavobacteriaceae bacterium]
MRVLFFALIFIFLNCDKKKENVLKDKYLVYTKEALGYVQEKGLSTEFYILVDLSIHSGKKRMFMIDLYSGEIRESFMATHGMGGGSMEENVVFSNVPNSHCSSKGKYILGSKKVYSPGYRHKYIMYGQENSNSNAVVRNVVFHPWYIVPSEETYPESIPMSWGCPAVSEEAFYHIDNLIQQTNGRVLMWVIN